MSYKYAFVFASDKNERIDYMRKYEVSFFFPESGENGHLFKSFQYERETNIAYIVDGVNRDKALAVLDHINEELETSPGNLSTKKVYLVTRPRFRPFEDLIIAAIPQMPKKAPESVALA